MGPARAAVTFRYPHLNEALRQTLRVRMLERFR
jgi:hypothetical protein